MYMNTTYSTKQSAVAMRKRMSDDTNKYNFNRKRILDRIREGSIPQQNTTKKYDISNAEVNAIRKEGNHPPLVVAFAPSAYAPTLAVNEETKRIQAQYLEQQQLTKNVKEDEHKLVQSFKKPMVEQRGKILKVPPGQQFALKTFHDYVWNRGADGQPTSWVINITGKKAKETTKIVALEPSLDNFQALIQNVDMASLNSRIEAKKIGLWYRTSYLSLQMKGKDMKDMKKVSAKWSVRVSETRDKTATVGMSIDRIKADNAYSEFDYVKIDIEGAENEVFGRGKLNWLSHVRLLSIEMHDKHVAGVTQMIINIIAKSLLHNLRTRPIPCAEYYVWFSPDVYDSELGSNTCFVNGTTRAVLNSKLKGH